VSSRSLGHLYRSGLVLLVGLSFVGCQNGSTVTKQEEDKFKDPPKEMPAEAARYMRDHGKPPADAKAPTVGETH